MPYLYNKDCLCKCWKKSNIFHLHYRQSSKTDGKNREKNAFHKCGIYNEYSISNFEWLGSLYHILPSHSCDIYIIHTVIAATLPSINWSYWCRHCHTGRGLFLLYMIILWCLWNEYEILFLFISLINNVYNLCVVELNWN